VHRDFKNVELNVFFAVYGKGAVPYFGHLFFVPEKGVKDNSLEIEKLEELDFYQKLDSWCKTC